MAPRIALSKPRIALIALVVLATLLALVVAISQRTTSDSEDERDQTTDESDPANATSPSAAQPSGAPGGTQRLQYDPKNGVTIQVPKRGYLSRKKPGTQHHTKPRRVDGKVNFPSVDRNPRNPGANDSVVVYATDRQRRITDVIVFGSFRSNGRLAEIHWLMSKDGVELVWDDAGKSSWTVERNGKLLTSNGDGHYFDSRPAHGSTRYSVRNVETVGDEMPVTYVAIMPQYDDRLLGSKIDAIGVQTAPGVKQTFEGAGTNADENPVEIARLVENFFIPDEKSGAQSRRRATSVPPISRQPGQTTRENMG